MPSVIESPSGRVPKKVPRWDIMGTEACGGGKVFWWTLLLIWEYLGIYSARIRVGGLPRGPQAREAPPLGHDLRAFGALGLFWPPLEAPWMSSDPRKIIVKFYSVWTPFDIPFL